MPFANKYRLVLTVQNRHNEKSKIATRILFFISDRYFMILEVISDYKHNIAIPIKISAITRIVYGKVCKFVTISTYKNKI